MQIKDMFEKRIERDIKGVIKVGQSDEENVYQELDEYVVTKELLKHFRDFFDNYEKGINGSTDKMGVWISGFFGSGKSHFLKILPTNPMPTPSRMPTGSSSRYTVWTERKSMIRC